jgi:hypothetical protein
VRGSITDIGANGIPVMFLLIAKPVLHMSEQG